MDFRSAEVVACPPEGLYARTMAHEDVMSCFVLWDDGVSSPVDPSVQCMLVSVIMLWFAPDYLRCQPGYRPPGFRAAGR